MRELRSRRGACVLLGLCLSALAAVGCANGGDDNSATIGNDGSSPLGDASKDAGHEGMSFSDGPVTVDGAGDSSSKPDSGSPDTGSTDTSAPDSGGPDVHDGAMPDTGMDSALDAPHDSAPDSPPDTGPLDTGMPDTGGCTTNAQCPGEVCDTTTHTCVQCLADGDCPLGELCTSHACTPGCNAGHGCPGSLACCNGVCDSLVDPQSCGACGRVCSSTDVQSLSCAAGGACNSSCLAGFGNCSQPLPPAPDDGCESNLNVCAGTPCCGMLCTGLHQNGLGQTYTDCAPLGVPGNPATYTANMANEANNAWPDLGSQSSGTCADPVSGMDNCVAQDDGFQAAVWCFSGHLAGYVVLTPDGTCLGGPCCPTTADSTWN
jgi:Cys-rich repeat protein